MDCSWELPYTRLQIEGALQAFLGDLGKAFTLGDHLEIKEVGDHLEME